MSFLRFNGSLNTPGINAGAPRQANWGALGSRPETMVNGVSPFNLAAGDRGDDVDEGGDIFTHDSVLNEIDNSLPSIRAQHQPPVQSGSLMFVTPANMPTRLRGHSLQTMNAFLYLFNQAAAPLQSIDEITRAYRFAGVCTTSTNDNKPGPTVVPGTTPTTYRTLLRGKWQDVIDVWSDSASLLSHNANPAWAVNLRSVVTSTLSEGVNLCVALVAMNTAYLDGLGGPPFVGVNDVDVLNDQSGHRQRASQVAVYQFVPFAFKRGVIPISEMFADFATPANAVTPSMAAGYQYPAAMFHVGTIHMRNATDVNSTELKLPNPRFTIFATNMASVTAAMQLCDKQRLHLPVLIDTSH